MSNEPPRRTRPQPWDWNSSSRPPVDRAAREATRARFAAAAKAANEAHDIARAATQAKTQRLRKLRLSRDAAATQKPTAEAARAKHGKAAGSPKATGE
jgi:hypothetical protein